MKLYRVTIEHEFFVSAEDHNQAEREAHRNLSKAMDDVNPWDCYVDEVSDVKTVPKDWRNSFPWGENNGKTCEQLLAQTES